MKFPPKRSDSFNLALIENCSCDRGFAHHVALDPLQPAQGPQSGGTANTEQAMSKTQPGLLASDFKPRPTQNNHNSSLLLHTRRQ